MKKIIHGATRWLFSCLRKGMEEFLVMLIAGGLAAAVLHKIPTFLAPPTSASQLCQQVDPVLQVIYPIQNASQSPAILPA